MLLYTTSQRNPQPGVFVNLQKIEKGESNSKNMMCHMGAISLWDVLFFFIAKSRVGQGRTYALIYKEGIFNC